MASSVPNLATRTCIVGSSLALACGGSSAAPGVIADGHGTGDGADVAAVLPLGAAGDVSTPGTAGAANTPTPASGGAATVQIDMQPEPEPSPDVSGLWFLVGGGDPMTIELVDEGTRLTGTGCIGALPSWTDASDYCAPLTGEKEGRQVRFRFGEDGAGLPYLVQAMLTASADGTRMTGTYAPVTSLQTAWVRLPEDAGMDDNMGILPDQTRFAEQWSYRLTLTRSIIDHQEYSALDTYSLRTDSSYALAGDFGAFWVEEVMEEVSEDGLRVEVGPVPVTEEHLPVAMTLTTNADETVTLEVTTASGGQYQLRSGI